MKCFKHQAREAVAICRACGKAACPECVLESENGIACQPSCAEILSRQGELRASHAAHLKNMKRMNFLGSLFSVGVGILFMYFASLGVGIVYDFVFLLGAGFVVYGIIAQIVNLFIFFKAKNYK